MAGRARKAPAVEPVAEEATTESEAQAPAVEPVAEEEVEHRIEVFEATRPDGTVVVITRDIDTGEQTLTEK